MRTVKHRSGELWVLMQSRRLGFGRNRGGLLPADAARGRAVATFRLG
jgi:hypothetical protein